MDNLLFLELHDSVYIARTTLKAKIHQITVSSCRATTIQQLRLGIVFY